MIERRLLRRSAPPSTKYARNENPTESSGCDAQGRLETIELTGFRLDELQSQSIERHWRRGGFPLSYLARSEADSVRWRQQFTAPFWSATCLSSGSMQKRQVKSPKVYVRDSGLVHQLLEIATEKELLAHPKLDLLLFKATHRIGVEIKRVDAPRITPSMKSALVDLALDRLVVLYPGDQAYSLSEKIDVLPAASLGDGDPRLFSPRRPRRAGRARSL